ncbi:hypothetical protein HZH68_014838 [Vespula germanica]|uniref:Uncharacterized protein n=1 Tax=Vespula germanica TaxID=30212 RepID=A0A834J8U0_VESGE|nr:hypothetical protein HZH68_014838 [Vespula germanica]
MKSQLRILGFARRQQSRVFDRLWFNNNGSVLLRISTSTHRSSRSMHSSKVTEKSQSIGSVLLQISKSTHRSFHSTHSPQNEMVWWGYSPTRGDNISVPIVIGSVLLRITKSTHRGFRSTHSLQHQGTVTIALRDNHDDDDDDDNDDHDDNDDGVTYFVLLLFIIIT